VLDEDGQIESNQVWVELEDGAQSLVNAYNLTTERLPNAPVWVAKTPEGYVVTGIRPRTGTELYLDAAASVNTPPLYGAVKNMTLDARQLLQGRVYLSELGGLNVRVDAFQYVTSDGSIRAFEGGDLDLTAYLPATADYWAWVWVGLTAAGELTAVTSEEVPFRDMLSMSLLAETDIGSMTPLDALKLQEGATALSADNEFTYARLATVGGGDMTSFNAAGDSGTPQTIGNGDTLTIAGGTGIDTEAGATDTVTIHLDVPVSHEHGGLEADVSAYDGYVRIASGATSEVKLNLNASALPTVNDDSSEGYSVGSRWVRTTGAPLLNHEWVCVDATPGAAVWRQSSLPAIPADNRIVVSNVGIWTASAPSFDANVITSGTLALARGGTQADLSATGGSGHVLKQASAGAAVTVGALEAGDIPNLAASKIASGTLAVARGGTGSGSTPSNGQLLIGNGSGYTLAT